MGKAQKLGKRGILQRSCGLFFAEKIDIK